MVNKTTTSKKTASAQAWRTICDSLAAAFRMDDAERAWLREKPIAQLIAAIPFLADCKNAHRTAVAHVGTYILSVRETKPFFNARSEDDNSVLDRLRLGMHFDGGDQRIIDRGMALLALSMVMDYRRDIQIDTAIGKHNPVATGAFDYDTIYRDLRRTIEATPCPEMDTILSVGDVGTRGYWSAKSQ